MAWVSPIYDRTATDITNRTSKAFFNVADWQRIYDNSLIVRNLVNSTYSLSVPFTTLTAPTTTSIPSAAEINSLVQNIELARAACGLPIALGLAVLRYDWQEGINAPTPDYEDVNDWERDLYLIYTLLSNAVDYAVHCGVGTVGQVRFWQNKFR
jgi:hypothetical protein